MLLQWLITSKHGPFTLATLKSITVLQFLVLAYAWHCKQPMEYKWYTPEKEDNFLRYTFVCYQIMTFMTHTHTHTHTVLCFYMCNHFNICN